MEVAAGNLYHLTIGINCAVGFLIRFILPFLTQRLVNARNQETDDWLKQQFPQTLCCLRLKYKVMFGVFLASVVAALATFRRTMLMLLTCEAEYHSCLCLDGLLTISVIT